MEKFFSKVLNIFITKKNQFLDNNLSSMRYRKLEI